MTKTKRRKSPAPNSDHDARFNMTQTQFARLIGISQQRVQKLIADHRLDGAFVRVGRKTRINPERAMVMLGRRLDPSGYEVDNGRPEPEPKAKPKPAPKKTDDVTDEEKQETIDRAGLDDSTSYNEARRLHETYKAALKKLEWETKGGQRVDINDLERVFFEAGRKVRDQLLAIPDRCAAMVAAEYDGDQHVCREILRREVLAVLNETVTSARELIESTKAGKVYAN